MSSKSLSIGSIFPKIVSETKTAPTKISASQSSKRGTVVMARSSTVKPVALRTSGSFIAAASMLSVAAIVSLLAFHLYTVNAYSSKGFELKRVQASIKELSDRQKKLLVQQAELGSITRVNEAAAQLGLVPIINEEYISANQLSNK